MAAIATGVFRAVAPPLVATEASGARLAIVVPAMTSRALSGGVAAGKERIRCLVVVFKPGAAPMTLQAVKTDGPAVTVKLVRPALARPGDINRLLLRALVIGNAQMAIDAAAALCPAEALEIPAMAIPAELFLVPAQRETHAIVIDPGRVENERRLAQASMHKMTVDTGADHPGVRTVARQPRLGDGLVTALAVYVRRAEKRVMAGAALRDLGGVRPLQLSRGQISLTRC